MKTFLARCACLAVLTGGRAEQLDTTFDAQLGERATVGAIIIQQDGRLVIGGSFAQVGGLPHTCLARLNVDRTRDTSFAANANGAVTSLALQPDGKILVGGFFTSVAGQPRSRVARINPDGSLDATFNPNANGAVHAIAIQSDQKIIIGGQFTSVAGESRSYIARLESNGSLDRGFAGTASGTLMAAPVVFGVYTIPIQPDGRIVLGGEFSSMGGQPRRGIGRLNSDGTLDPTFNPAGTGGGHVNQLSVLPDGRMLVAGNFTFPGPFPRTNLARLLSNGSVDPAFTSAPPNTASAIAPQSDGRFLIGGFFTSIGAQSRHFLVRLEPGGALVPEFETGIENITIPQQSAPGVQVITPPQNGVFYIGGTFTRIAGYARNGLARIVTSESSVVFTTLAGMPPGGSVDGAASAARFRIPLDVAVDAAGNAYVADAASNLIRKISPAGFVSTFAGTAGESGSVDGTGSAARLNSPTSVAVDTSGNVYVADTGNHSIRKISAAGVVTTLAGVAGQTLPGYVDGSGSLARFQRPQGIAVDPNGNVWVADTGNVLIRRITPAGVVSTIAGSLYGFGDTDGSGPAAKFSHLTAIEAVANGDIYVADVANARIRRITPAGVVSTVTNAAGGRLEIIEPRGIAAAANGNLYVSTLHAIVQISPSGAVTPVAGNPAAAGNTDRSGTAARFKFPAGLAVTPTGALLVADSFNDTIRRILPDGATTTLAGVASRGSADGAGFAARFDEPAGVAIDVASNAYVTDRTNATIRKISPTGVVSTFAGTPGQFGSADGIGPAASFDSPTGIAVDSAGNLFVADSGGCTIRKITPGGAVTTIAGSPGRDGSADGVGANARFNGPTGIAVDTAGTLYVADSGNNTVRKISSAGAVATLAGTAGDSFFGGRDGLGAAARFASPRHVAVDASGNVFVTDYFNHTIRKITPAGAVTTFAGTTEAVSAGTVDGPRAIARFDRLSGLTIDHDGHLFVTDANSIRRVMLDGSVSTVAGTGRTDGSVDGVGSAVRFLGASGIAVDPHGTLFVADEGNNTLRRGVPVALAGSSRLANLSVRSSAGTGPATLIVGFSLAGNGAKPVLLRGVGPALAGFGVQNTLANPTLRLDVFGGPAVGENDDWEASGGAGALSAAAASVGAFPLSAGSRDAGLLRTLNPATYTAQIGGGTGVALVEAYDTGGVSGARLANVSARTFAGTGGDVLIAGFVIAGNGAKTLLIRAIGPTLEQFGVEGALPDPSLQIAALNGPVVAVNDDWGSFGSGMSATDMAATFRRIGAFPLAPGSSDAAVVITLPPGGYTAQITPGSGRAGIALVEVYDLP
jgi:uncharacterized delta-60 repeat protein